jgi:hypothetical protein
MDGKMECRIAGLGDLSAGQCLTTGWRGGKRGVKEALAMMERGSEG